MFCYCLVCKQLKYILKHFLLPKESDLFSLIPKIAFNYLRPINGKEQVILWTGTKSWMRPVTVCLIIIWWTWSWGSNASCCPQYWCPLTINGICTLLWVHEKNVWNKRIYQVERNFYYYLRFCLLYNLSSATLKYAHDTLKFRDYNEINDKW